MASSSDWFAAAQQAAQPSVSSANADDSNQSGPAWLREITGSTGFVERFPASTRDRPAAPKVDAKAAQDKALAQAFAEGEAAGHAAAQAQAAKDNERARAMRLSFRALDQAAIDTLAGELSQTVAALCEQVLGENAFERGALTARCEAAAARIGQAAGALTLHLNPEDIAMLGDSFTAGWSVQPDAALERGNIRLAGPDGTISDGPREWRRAIAAALAG